jgi:hypothetical protein
VTNCGDGGAMAEWEDGPHILFDGSETEPTDLESVIFQALGAASVCWDNMLVSGTFDSTRAKAIGEEALSWIKAHYVLRESDDTPQAVEGTQTAEGSEASGGNTAP